MATTKSQENYLEIIFLLSKRGAVRAIDVAVESGFSKASVSSAMKQLKTDGFVFVDAGNQIILTAKGESIAKAVYERHRYITAYLVETLDIDAATAEADACKMEHIISDKTYHAIKKKIREGRRRE